LPFADAEKKVFLGADVGGRLAETAMVPEGSVGD
jgi:hypothetical protein